MPAIDSLTEVPSDVYAEFSKAGELARCGGQHVLGIDLKGRQHLTHFSTLQMTSSASGRSPRRASQTKSSMECSSRSASWAPTKAALSAIPSLMFSSRQKGSKERPDRLTMPSATSAGGATGGRGRLLPVASYKDGKDPRVSGERPIVKAHHRSSSRAQHERAGERGALQSSSLPPCRDSEPSAKHVRRKVQQRTRANRPASAPRAPGHRGDHSECLGAPLAERDEQPDENCSGSGQSINSAFGLGAAALGTPDPVAKLGQPRSSLRITTSGQTDKIRSLGTYRKDALAVASAPSSLFGSPDISYFSDRLSAALGWCQPTPFRGALNRVHAN